MQRQSREALSQEKTLLLRLGGTRGIEAIVHDFYRRVLLDRTLAKNFKGIDLERLKEKQIDVFIQATGGLVNPATIEIPKAYIHVPLCERYFRNMRTHLIESLLSSTIPFATIDEVVALLRPHLENV